MSQAPHASSGATADHEVPPGLDPVSPYDGAPPGIPFTGQWRAVDPAADSDGSRMLCCGVARCP